MSLDTELDALWMPSPNFNARSEGAQIHHLILHYTGMKTAEGACERLCDVKAQVSSHYLVDEKGKITQMVAENKRAWHAGVSYWAGSEDINSTSVGIEIHNPGHEHGYKAFANAQIERVTALLQDILSRHDIPMHHVLAHSDIAPDRKMDPGEKFPWARLSASGIGHYVPPAPITGGRFFQLGDEGEPVEALQSLLALYGYRIDIHGKYDDRTELVVKAFQRHFRPEKVDGVADSSTITTLHQLIKTMEAS